ncbi:hypothetical protein NIES2135_32250 [Leptolyngbya boryana NIES-2135]|jgi:hypothetical protein|uniref:Uncharacterized protein n=1 Tax=Leptolyngbya boryana NIES-2135 TaxID=1973484 RepID=A0A1Z4JI14_LEPBY|nr:MULTISPECIES: hypothetical protein [Leptolyngbya]BAY56394.1 hypothetical protein NIES2135_32250 [Leptolyngbya boryana NIES-2135]MBD2366500.1 hypothetical protein [Leptolyngbya sp. FACHB-161]MBD2372679.1 hypothetical protein [Leptolyngbya sp. FACHB-238]MBD2397102.1 hypothetical protein [Leptolyngbya sp. FACHB-239]MBD2403626.1 hypothetical protein [Leptolyngbya sp. FACHB-402]
MLGAVRSTVPVSTATTPPWITANLQNGWTSFTDQNTVYPPVSYRKHLNGMVELQGMATKNSPGGSNVLLNLPGEFRPNVAKRFPGSDPNPFSLIIYPSGDLQLTYLTATISSIAFIPLDVIQFFAN